MTILFSFIQEIKLLTKLDCANNPITQNPPLNSFRKNSQLHHVLSKERKIGTFFLRKLFYLVTLSGFMFLFYVRSMRQFEELSGVEKERWSQTLPSPRSLAGDSAILPLILA